MILDELILGSENINSERLDEIQATLYQQEGWK